MPTVKVPISSLLMLDALRQTIGEDGILHELYTGHNPGTPESKILFEAWGKLRDPWRISPEYCFFVHVHDPLLRFPRARRGDTSRLLLQPAAQEGKPMTVLHYGNNVVRETCSYYRRRALVVRLSPRHIEIREKGRREYVAVDYVTLYEFALKQRFKREQAEKRAKRKVSRSGQA